MAGKPLTRKSRLWLISFALRKVNQLYLVLLQCSCERRFVVYCCDGDNVGPVGLSAGPIINEVVFKLYSTEN